MKGISGGDEQANVYIDNLTTVNFVNGEVEVKAARHMELKLYWVREKIRKGSVRVGYMEGEVLPADMLTKVVTRKKFRRFVRDLQGGIIRDEMMMDGLDSDDEIDNNEMNMQGRRVQPSTGMQLGSG